MITKEELLQYLAKLPDGAIVKIQLDCYYDPYIGWELKEKPDDKGHFTLCEVVSRP